MSSITEQLAKKTSTGFFIKWIDMGVFVNICYWKIYGKYARNEYVISIKQIVLIITNIPQWGAHAHVPRNYHGWFHCIWIKIKLLQTMISVWKILDVINSCLWWYIYTSISQWRTCRNIKYKKFRDWRKWLHYVSHVYQNYDRRGYSFSWQSKY